MPATIETATYLALKEHTETFDLPTGVVFVYPKADAPKQGKYIAVDWLPNTITRFGLSPSGSSQRPGILQFSIMSPLAPAQAPEVDLDLAGRLAAHFPQDLSLFYDSVRVKILRPGDVAQSYRDSGYWRTPVSVFYSVDQ
jgi:hypothetical protein